MLAQNKIPLVRAARGAKRFTSHSRDCTLVEGPQTVPADEYSRDLSLCENLPGQRAALIARFLSAGLVLVPIPHGQKGPTHRGWNLPENAIRTSEEAAKRLNGSSNIGLAHAYCDPPTCAIDIDNLEKARPWLADRGIDIVAWLNAPDATRIVSPRDGSEKLLYWLPQKMQSCVVKDEDGKTILEFRCGTADGLTVQDVLPPSIHPMGRPYRLIGNVENMQPIPDMLLKVWQQEIGNKRNKKQGATEAHGALPKRFIERLNSDEKLRKRWDGDTEGLNDPSCSGLDMSLTTLLVLRGFNDAEITAVLHVFPHGKVVRDGREGDYINDMIAKARQKRTLSRTEPLRNAYRLVAERYTTQDGTIVLRHWRGDLYLWRGGAYRLLQPGDVQAEVYAYLDGAHCMTKKGREPFAPNRTKVGDMLDALRMVAHLESHKAPPCWLDEERNDEPKDLLATANGLLHMPSRTLRPHNARFFTTTALPFAYDPDAGPPEAWLRFLHDLWGDDVESIETLQEFFGYVLTSDCSRQKILTVVGPKRGGKGTIARVLRALLGEENYAGPTLASISTNFGLQPLIGKRLAIISDARLGSRADQQVLAERLLSISGEDALTIDRKYAEQWTGPLGVRLMLLTNELPKVTDASGALASRFIILRLTKSWLNHEDFSLADRLMGELPGILNWGLDGLERLRSRGQFRQPATAMELVRELEDLSSPVSAFLHECCVVESGARAACHEIFMAWRCWCSVHGREHPGTEASFGRDLHAVLPELHVSNVRVGGGRKRFYEGVRLCTGDDRPSLL